MRRRDLLVGGMALAQVVASRNSLGQPAAPSTRAAVVIGVDKAGDMPVLRAAVSGARQVADWLKAEGVEVFLHVDDAQPVTAQAVKQTVTALVNRGTLTQLIIYFAGHGVSLGYNELWLLSGAPIDPNEAVSVVECVELARASGIPHVVFVSDACRSDPGFNPSRIQGTLVFPNLRIRPGAPQPEIDRFFATLPGAPSYEIATAANYVAIYTSTLLDAFKHPDAGMVRAVSGDNVIPNRSLKPFLLREVPKRLRQMAVQYNQEPESRIESGEMAYIGRALAPAAVAAATPPQQATIADIANHQLNATGIGPLASLRGINADTLTRAADETGFNTTQRAILESARASQSARPAPDAAAWKTGFEINGAGVRTALVTGDSRAQIVDRGRGPGAPARVKITQPRDRAVTVALQFEDGSGTVVAALPGFTGSLTVERGRVISLTYLPSRNSGRWSEYNYARERLDRLHALVATSAKFGVFRIEGGKEDRSRAAARLADQIRILKAMDPTLGLYAAYAYADANLPQQVQSVRFYMRDDLSTDLFDVALLADLLRSRDPGGPNSPVPFCPMLTQGWQLLRVKEVRLLPELQAAREFLLPSLWATFEPQGMDLIARAIAPK
jgi:hypothetical protein